MSQMKQDPSLVRSRNHQAERVKLDTTQFQNHTLARLSRKLIRENENSLDCDICDTWIHVNVTKLISLITKSLKTKLNLGIVFATIGKYLIF